MGTFAQYHIKAKLITYLQQEKGRDPLFLATLSGGHCSGFACLWLYTKYISSLPRQYNLFGKPILRDDNDWFWKTLKLLSDWNTKRLLTLAEKSNIELLLAQISHFQDTRRFGIAQGSLDKTLQDTRDRQCEREYSLAAIFTKDELTETLSKIVHNDRLILISSHNHDIGLIKIYGIYYLYNSNNAEGEHISADVDSVAKEIFKAMGFGLAANKAPLGFRVYHFADNHEETPVYPHQGDILQSLSFIKNNQIDMANPTFKSRTALIMATFINCDESIEFLLENGADPNRLDLFKMNALMFTLTHGNILAALKLVQHSADITQKNWLGHTYRDFDYANKISNCNGPDIIAKAQLHQQQLNNPEIIIDKFASKVATPLSTKSSEISAKHTPNSKSLFSFLHLLSFWKPLPNPAEKYETEESAEKTQCISQCKNSLKN